MKIKGNNLDEVNQFENLGMQIDDKLQMYVLMVCTERQESSWVYYIKPVNVFLMRQLC